MKPKRNVVIKMVTAKRNSGLLLLCLLTTINVLVGQSHSPKDSLNQLAAEAFNRHDYQRALQHFSDVQQLDSMDDVVYIDLGMTYERMHKFEKAIDLFSKQIAIDPESVDAYFMRGMNYQRLQRFSEASKDYHTVLMLENGNSDAHLYLAQSFAKLGAFKEAYDELEEAYSLKKQEPLSLLIKAYYQLAEGKRKAGKRTLDRIDTNSYEHPLYYFVLACYYNTPSKQVKSTEAYQQFAASISPGEWLHTTTWLVPLPTSNGKGCNPDLNDCFQLLEANTTGTELPKNIARQSYSKPNEILYMSLLASHSDYQHFFERLDRNQTEDSSYLLLKSLLLYTSGNRTEACLEYERFLLKSEQIIPIQFPYSCPLHN